MDLSHKFTDSLGKGTSIVFLTLSLMACGNNSNVSPVAQRLDLPKDCRDLRNVGTDLSNQQYKKFIFEK